MMIETFPAIASLSIQDKLQLASELWEDVLCGDQNDQELKELLERRLREYHENPQNVISMEEVRLRFNLKKWRGQGTDLLESGVDQLMEDMRGR